MFLLGRRSALACVALAVALGVTGCGGGGSKPVSLPTLPTSTSPASSSAHEDPALAAEGVVRSYYDVINGLRNDMDARALASLMTKDCTCQQQVRAIAAAAAKNEHFIDQARLVSLTPAVNSSEAVDVLVQYDASRGGLVDSQGRHLTSAPAKRGLKRLFHLRKIGARWLIVEIDDA